MRLRYSWWPEWEIVEKQEEASGMKLFLDRFGSYLEWISLHRDRVLSEEQSRPKEELETWFTCKGCKKS